MLKHQTSSFVSLILLSAGLMLFASCSSDPATPSAPSGGAGSGAIGGGGATASGGTATVIQGGSQSGGAGSSSGGSGALGGAPSADGGEGGSDVTPIARPGFRGPLNSGPDPFLTFYSGNYYLGTTQGGSLKLWRAPTLGGLLTADAVTVWTDTDTTRNQQIWAPSFYLFDGHWYLYYTADDGIDDHHRLQVIESDGTDPLGPYHYKAKLVPPGAENYWAIDPVILIQTGKKYMVWSGAGSEGHNVLYVAPMSNAWTISGARVYLAAAGGCPEVREAPAILQHDGTTFLSYSTCDTGKPDYQLWMLRLASGADPLVAKNWQQVSGAVFARNDAGGVFGPGSNGFFKSPDGSEDWLVYHGKNTATVTYGRRTTRAGKIRWQADGTPDFGMPANVTDTLTLPAGDPGDSPFLLDDSAAVQPGGDASIAFDSAWHSENDCGNQCSAGNDHIATQTDATATIAFTGTRVALLSVHDVDRGIAAFSLDGGAEKTSDYYLSPGQGSQIDYISPRLPSGAHQLKVRVTGKKNAASSGTAISVDRVEVDTR